MHTHTHAHTHTHTRAHTYTHAHTHTHTLSGTHTHRHTQHTQTNKLDALYGAQVEVEDRFFTVEAVLVDGSGQRTEVTAKTSFFTRRALGSHFHVFCAALVIK